MNGNRIDSLYGSVLYTPYSKEEADEFVYSSTAPIRAVLDDARHRYIALIRLIDCWMQHCEGIGDRPPDAPLRFILPGRTAENNEIDNYEKIAAYFSHFPHGSTPHISELCDTSRSCLTFLCRLAAIKESHHLKSAWEHYNKFINLIDYKGKPQMVREEFKRRMDESCENFFRERNANALEIGKILTNPQLGADAAQEIVPKSVRRDNIRLLAVSLIKAYQIKTNCSRNNAIKKVQAVLWKDFYKVGLDSDVRNFAILFAKPKFRDAPPGSEDDLRRACLSFGR